MIDEERIRRIIEFHKEQVKDQKLCNEAILSSLMLKHDQIHKEIEEHIAKQIFIMNYSNSLNKLEEDKSEQAYNEFLDVFSCPVEKQNISSLEHICSKDIVLNYLRELIRENEDYEIVKRIIERACMYYDN